MGAPRCCVCPRSVADGHSLFRANAKGQPALWVCESHIGNTDRKVDAEIITVVRELEERNANS